MTPRNFCARSSPLQRWRRLSRFGSAALPAALARARGLLPRPTSGRRLAGVAELRKSLEDDVPLGHAGRTESGLHEQAPRATAPFLSADFLRLGWRRHEGSAPAEFLSPDTAVGQGIHGI